MSYFKNDILPLIKRKWKMRVSDNDDGDGVIDGAIILKIELINWN